MKQKLKVWLLNRKRRALYRELDDLDKHGDAIERRKNLVMRELLKLGAASVAAQVKSPSSFQGVPRPSASRAIPVRRKS